MLCLKWITYETRVILESMCYGNMCYLSVDNMWDLFEPLAWHQWHYEYASKSFVEHLAISATKLFKFSKNATNLTFYVHVPPNLVIVVKNTIWIIF